MNAPLPIEKPCPLVQDLFRSGGSCSFCDSCGHKVHNLSEMSRAERKALIKRYHAGERVCVAYRLNAAGGVVLPPEPRKSRFVRLFGAWLTLGVAGCSTPNKFAGRIGQSTSPEVSQCAPKDVRPSGKESGKVTMLGGVPPERSRWQRFKDIFR